MFSSTMGELDALPAEFVMRYVRPLFICMDAPNRAMKANSPHVTGPSMAMLFGLYNVVVANMYGRRSDSRNRSRQPRRKNQTTDS